MIASIFTYFPTVAEGIGNTVVVTLASFALGVVLAVPLVLARRGRLAPLRWLAIAYIELFRGVPPVAWLFIVFFGIGSGAITLSPIVASIIALGLVSGAYMAEIFRSGIQSVAKGQWEGAQAIGLSHFHTLRYVIAPQAMLVAVPPAATYLVGLLKDSALASIIGVQDVTFQAFNLTQQTLKGMEIFTVAAVIYIAISIPLAVFSRWLDSRLSRRVATS